MLDYLIGYSDVRYLITFILIFLLILIISLIYFIVFICFKINDYSRLEKPYKYISFWFIVSTFSICFILSIICLVQIIN